MGNENQELTIRERLAILETKVDSILNNHFPTLEKQVRRLFWANVGALFTLVGVLLREALK